MTSPGNRTYSLAGNASDCLNVFSRSVAVPRQDVVFSLPTGWAEWLGGHRRKIAAFATRLIVPPKCAGTGSQRR